ncbi:MAG: hypothetical protein ACLFV2_02865 [Desulfurivibrionaceae bacterium]
MPLYVSGDQFKVAVHTVSASVTASTAAPGIMLGLCLIVGSCLVVSAPGTGVTPASATGACILVVVSAPGT